MRYNRHYYWKKIDQTPFTVVVTFPGNAQNQIQIPEHEVNAMKSKPMSKYFQGNYRLHPDWIYCRSLKKNFEDMKLGDIDPDDCEMTPEEELEYFFEKFEKSGWNWKTPKNEKGAYKCDKSLVQALMFDAKAIENYPHDLTKKTSDSKKYIDRHKVYSSFISTHSGLLKFKIYEDDELENKKLSEEFGNSFKRSIDEDWYKHTVQFNRHEPKSFIYSLPFDVEYHEKPLLTVTTTVFATDARDRAPIAVVGFQIAHEEIENLFGDKVSVVMEIFGFKVC